MKNKISKKDEELKAFLELGISEASAKEILGWYTRESQLKPA